MSIERRARNKAFDHVVPRQAAVSTTSTAASGTGSSTGSGSVSTPFPSSTLPVAASTNGSQTTPTPTYLQPTTRILLGTTFTPEPSCAENLLSQMPPPGYLIWANEPVPAANQTHSGCYPPEFLRQYTSVSSGDVGSSIVPAMQSLVCPVNWCTMIAGDNNYGVCCPSGYQFHRPDSTLIASRPGYGGTCYSDFTVSVTYTVTAYNVSGATMLAPWTASTSGAQAYAHPIDGFAVSPPNVSCDRPKTAKPKTSAGVIAGATVGALVGLALILLLVLYVLRSIKLSRRRELQIEHTQHDMGSPALRVGGTFEKEGKSAAVEAPATGKKWGYEARASPNGETIFEMPGDSVPELEGDGGEKKDRTIARAELEGDRRQRAKKSQSMQKWKEVTEIPNRVANRDSDPNWPLRPEHRESLQGQERSESPDRPRSPESSTNPGSPTHSQTPLDNMNAASPKIPERSYWEGPSARR
ncbi:hypothetical protein GQ43DRAFT_303356 [Delitschia confertaspora ATCC 74209]|uniref:Uncharacterized protein n=1 Tax=Delitschia confertaspora ATCC 74209 TaxID=1513339 RepID=A0A9P4JP65_9PLEO|nr:hypothetical protein GQ43DRAFT_303356 [Delitschia confertaspora ATCC 74209]